MSEAGANIPNLPDRKTLNQKFSAYCKVCWNPVYCLWIDSADPHGVCFENPLNTDPTKCSDAIERAKLSSLIARLRREGVLAPLPPKRPGESNNV